MDRVDAGLFKLSRNEAAVTDPQQRLLLEQAAASWADAGAGGFTADLPAGDSLTGVFVGCMYHEWIDVIVEGTRKLPPQAVVGSGLPYMVGRISYTFGFTGAQGCR